MTMTLRLAVTSATEVTLLNLPSMRSSCGSGKSTAPFHFWLFLHLLHILGTKTSATGPLPRKTGSLETTRRSTVCIWKGLVNMFKNFHCRRIVALLWSRSSHWLHKNICAFSTKIHCVTLLKKHLELCEQDVSTPTYNSPNIGIGHVLSRLSRSRVYIVLGCLTVTWIE